MSTDRLVFIPFNRSQATDFIDEARRANNHGSGATAHRARKFSVVCYDDAGTPLEDLGFSFGTRILIAGHGLAGRPYISNSTGIGQKQYLPFNVVCDRLIEKGLQKRYAGTISCDVCYSAVKNDRNPPFADLIARYLHKKGYKLVNTIGYMGPMGAVHEKMSGNHKYYHRVVDLVSDDGTKKTVKSSDGDARERYFGVWSIPKHLEGLSLANDTCPAF
ncbi:hypothetical protein [Mesorhizobium sp.]|uniref:hypothetical protein n=1 Tax=Mesorhizobium sp. TaxID=1871066 RepID=UPI0025FC3679|nr:hypothetical protein [Mesorhizobium sp.]